MMENFLVNIKFVPHIDGMELVDEVCPQPANNFIPEWFKKMPLHEDRDNMFKDMGEPGKILVGQVNLKLQRSVQVL